MKKIVKQILCTLLTFALVWVGLPLSGFAADVGSLGQITTDSTAELVTDESREPLFLLSEDTDSRSENTKVFFASDGSKTMVLYPSPVHYLEDGVYREIDNTLAVQNGRLTTTASPAKISFPTSLTASAPVTYAIGEHSVSFTLQNTSTSFAAARQPKESEADVLLARAKELRESKTLSRASTETLAAAEALSKELEEELTTPHKLYSGADYEGVFANTDLSFSLVGTTLKEDIILSSLPSETSYTYRLQTTLKAELQESGAVIFFADKTPVIEIQAPYMTDSADNRSREIEVRLETVRDGYSYTITPNRAWLTDPARVYPVTIDPTFQESNISAVKDNYAITDLGGTSSATFNSIVEDLTESKTEIGAGNYVSTVKVGTLIYADLISKLEENSLNARVLDAKLTLAQINSSCGSARVVQAHRITSDWGVSNIAEDTPRVNTAVPNHENTVLDYYRTPSSLTAGDQFEIDITSAVQKWATGHSENYGIYLEVADSDGTKDLVYWGSSDQSAFEKPQFSINYRDTMGVEDYWTYSSVSAGRYGMAAVNNYNGNLVSTQTICGTDGLRLPVEIALTYNSGITGEAKFTKAGTGWKFNFETLICASEEAIAADYPYYLLDSDGTKHYFKASEEENEWVDEDGLGLTLTYENFANSTSIAYYILTATDGSYSKFHYSGGRIFQTYDTEGNYIQVNYSSGSTHISSVRDGAGRTYSFAYEGSRVSTITDPANRSYTFAYDDDLLESITYPDGVKTEFTYTSLTGGDSLLSAVSNPDETSTRITYKNGKHNRVDTLGTYSSDAQRMSQLSFDYASPNRTVVTDLDGRKLEYQFDRMGQTINLFYPEEQMAAYYEYGAEGGATKKITESSKVQAPTINLITNHGFKDLTGWSAENGGSATGTAELSTSVCFADNNSLLVVKTDTNPDSVLGRKYTVGALGAGYYTLSAYLKTENLTAYTADGGAKLVLTYTDADGAVQKAQSAPISTSEDWQRLSVTLRTETAITNATVSLVVENANGTAYFDAVQFEAAAVANRYNLLYNNDLEQSSSGALSGWSTRALTSADGPSTSERFTGEHSFHIQGSPTAYKNISQRVNVCGDAYDGFVYSAFAKGTSRPNDGHMYTFSVVVEFYNADGFTERFITPFNFGSDDWQYVSGAAVASEPYTYVQFYLCYYRNVNDVYFDAPQFYREKFGDSYTYDDEGNLTSVTDAADTETTYEYDENNELVSVNNPSGTSDTFVYDENKPHRLISETVAGLNTSYSYDNYGNSLGSTVRLADDTVSSAHISNSSTYTDNGNYLASETDALGNTVSYSYDANTGTLSSVTDPKGNATTYTYNFNNAPTSVSQGNSTVGYTYTDDRLATISTENATYTFTYDEAGNTEQIKVGDRTLITNAYDLSRGLLSSELYGNGYSVSYEYDSLDRVRKVYRNGEISPVYEYVYDNAGNLVRVLDYVRDTELCYTYDLAERLIHIEDSDGLSISYEYDDAGRQYKTEYTVDGETLTQELVYGTGEKADLLTELKQNGQTARTYSYDAFNRLISATLNTTTPVETTYTYKAHETIVGRTSTVVETVKVGTNTARRFEYDQNGNIVREYEGDTLRYEYTYDALGQLTGFTNSYPYGYSSGAFTYDENGNILQKTLDGVTDTYTYGDSSWGDLLTAYNGNAITYDAIGNPLTYYDGSTFTWQNGRQLASAVVDGKNISFEYNADGMRSAKVVDGVRTEYLYDGAMLLKETQTDADGDLVYTVSFTYDESGRPFSAKFDGHTYYYVYDVYGNVNYVYNEAGTRVMRCTYTDPWNLDMRTQATGTGSAFNTVNPFLYKGYYYDTDLDMYYCGSRYYDWETCRWLNEDAYASTGQGVLGYNMTTYCNNDPVNMIDAMADAPKYITKQTNNTKIDGKKMKDIRFGLGNIANNGCGVIAVYNVLLSKNAKIKFDSVRQGIIACGGTLLLGLAGSSPSGLVAYLQSRFWTVRTAGPITTFWTSKANLSEAIIILIKCKEGINMHYIAGIGTGKKGYFKFYNSGMKDSNSKSIDGRAITISTFLKYALINRVAPLFFIGVSNKMKWW